VQAVYEEVLEVLSGVKREYCEPEGSGVALTLYSVVVSHGAAAFAADMDRPEQLVGAHGHCSQELVNLFLTGRACSNVFDGEKQVDEQCRLQGVSSRGLFGFLTIFEHLGYMEVGSLLKQPLFPAWVVSKEYHYSVVFGLDWQLAHCPALELDLLFYDGLYSPDKRIRLTLRTTRSPKPAKVVPMIEQVLWTRWGRCEVDWNGADPIL
jgi:hypothetical protein